MIPASVRIFICVHPIDMRLGFDRLVQTARERMGQDPCAGGALFVFGSKRATRIKVLWFEGRGLCLLYKRLHNARFEIPYGANGAAFLQINATAFTEILAGVDEGRRSKKWGEC